eukprot:3282639-Pyramimonas_sp.AAC.1
MLPAGGTGRRRGGAETRNGRCMALPPLRWPKTVQRGRPRRAPSARRRPRQPPDGPRGPPNVQ